MSGCCAVCVQMSIPAAHNTLHGIQFHICNCLYLSIHLLPSRPRKQEISAAAQIYITVLTLASDQIKSDHVYYFLTVIVLLTCLLYFILF